MKKTIIFASVALATLFAFSSCQKETLQDNGSTNGVRIITAEFENNATKTDLNSDGVTPEWAVGDKIRILNATTYQDVDLVSGETPLAKGHGIIGDGKIVIAIDDVITGTLYAVYPASATTMTSCSGSIDFTIPTVQDGTFASANICVAKSMGDDETNKDNLVFSNATSVLEFSQTASSTQVLRVAVTAANAIAGKLTASFGDNNKATISTDGLTGKIIYTTAAATAQDKYYVAVAPVETGDITFNYYKAVEEKSESKTTKTLALNKIYALTIPTEEYTKSYVEIKMTVGGQEKTYKWAKCNIGATKETDYGDYYAWGETAPYYEVTGGWPATPTWKSGKASGYAWQSYCGSSNFSEWSTPPYDATTKILKPEFDAAAQILGNGWRMPTSAEFKALYDACLNGSYDTSTNPSGASASFGKGAYWCTSYDGVAGCLFCDGTNKLFFPAAGSGNGTVLSSAGSNGYYWSSSLETGDTDYAYYLYFNSGNVYPQRNRNRYYGFSVRPVSD